MLYITNQIFTTLPVSVLTHIQWKFCLCTQVFTYPCSLTVWIQVAGIIRNLGTSPSSGWQRWTVRYLSLCLHSKTGFYGPNVWIYQRCPLLLPTGEGQTGSRKLYPEFHSTDWRVRLPRVRRVSHCIGQNQLLSHFWEDPGKKKHLTGAFTQSCKCTENIGASKWHN